ncbi:YeeE/YedE thiosulfate transporter family protein [Arthrobacter sp. SLBN-53]|uniref:YeeE/YedE thiosulfate transporter family protein n=1 Tax=Arthrobacter sp. SLBN-53 TaxID=2768412 RepID=UPI00336A4692
MWVGLPLGVGFGAIASLWGIGNPETIIRAARLIDRLLPACFLLVTALGSVLLYGLHASGLAMHFSPKPTYIYGVVLGGILFGVGLALSGYLPGTALMAIGEGRRDALLAIPGGLLGASAWTALADTGFGRWIVSEANFGDLVAGGNIHDVPPARMVAIALVYAAAALGALYFLPRYRASRHCCLRSIRGADPDAYDRQMALDTTRYLNEGAREPAARRIRLALRRCLAFHRVAGGCGGAHGALGLSRRKLAGRRLRLLRPAPGTASPVRLPTWARCRPPCLRRCIRAYRWPRS